MSDDLRKIQPGPSGATNRLPSFRAARDLSLGSGIPGRHRLTGQEKPRKVFTPNVNVQRKKNRDTPTANDSPAEKEAHHGRGPRSRPHERTRNSVTLVQASGSVFAEGVAVTKSHGSKSSRHSSEYTGPPVLRLKHDVKPNKEEEDFQLKELLRDDFIDDDDMPDPTYGPVSLPFRKRNKATAKNEVKAEPAEISAKKETKGKKTDGIKIKQEVVEETELLSLSEEENQIRSELKEDSRDTTAPSVKNEVNATETEEGTVTDGPSLLDMLNSNERYQLLVQLPDRLPCLPVGGSDGAGSSGQSSKQKSQGKETSKTEEPYCCLEDLEPGRIGVLQVRKSGKVELVLGNCVMNVTQGTSVGFRQDLVAALLDPNTLTGDTVDLGPISGRLICTPDWDSLLRDGTD